MSSINNICNRYLQLTTIVISLALNVFKLQMQKKKKKKKRLQQQRNKSKIIRTLQISIYSVSNGPIDRKESKKERKKRGAIFRSTGCRRYLTSFSTRSGTRSSRLRETERERENSSFVVSSTFSENIQPIFPDTTVSYTANKSWLNSYDSVVSNYDRHIGNRWMIFL